MGKPLLSIVVPTKNRYTYLYKLVELIDSFHSDEIEMCISDNSDDNTAFVDFLEKGGYKDKIVYKHYTERLSQSGNSDKAILLSSGEYVCFIGDDDGVIPEIIPMCKKLKDMGAEAIYTNKAFYNWPDYFDKKYQSMVFYNTPTGEIEQIDAKQELEFALKGGFRSIGRMPQVYHGIVKRSVLDKLYDKVGTYSPGASPDMATAVSLSLIVEKLYYVNLPLIIAGQSIHVGGGELALKGNLPKIGDVPYLPSTIVRDWNSRIPDVWCSDTIWPQSAIYALTLMGYPGVKDIDYDNLLALFLKNHSRYYSQYKHLANNILRVNFLIYGRKLREKEATLRTRLMNVLRREKSSSERLTECGIININGAAAFLSKLVS